MEKTYISYYPFSVSAETKTSKAGKQYLSIGVCHKSKDKDGNKKETYFNLINDLDLLILASACNNMYDKIQEEKSKEYLASKQEESLETVEPVQETVQPVQPSDAGFDDEIPF